MSSTPTCVWNRACRWPASSSAPANHALRRCTMARVMEIVTPLGADVVLFHSMHAREELGRVGEAQIDLLSTKSDVNLDDILGKNVTVKLALGNDGTRFFNGYVT